MEETKIIIKNILSDNFDQPISFKKNLIKEYLQVLVLDYLYANPKYNNLVFYGGSCLSQCFDLPRLSEDLDFVDLKKKADLKKLAEDLETFFENKTDLPVATKIQKFRIYLKFPILKELEMFQIGESDLLFLKVEIFQGFDFCKNYHLETKPLFKFNKSILVKTFDLPTLMSTKIRAILYRKWEKTDKAGKILIKVKGRDYFDLMWYLDKGIKPNLNCLEIKDKEQLKNKLMAVIDKIDYRSIVLDLENFISNRDFVINLSKNIKNILKNSVNNL
jgi:hypothetical protein